MKILCYTHRDPNCFSPLLVTGKPASKYKHNKSAGFMVYNKLVVIRAEDNRSYASKVVLSAKCTLFNSRGFFRMTLRTNRSFYLSYESK